MRSGEACTRSAVRIDASGSIREAVRLMREHPVGDLVIQDSGNGSTKPIGMVTDRDLTIEGLATDLDVKQVNIGDLFPSPRLITAYVDEELEITLETMQNHGIRRMPVVELDGSLVGILSLDDVTERLSEQLAVIAGLLARQPTLEARRRA